MNQRDVVENGNSQLTQIFPGGVLEEITVLRAQYVCLTDDGRLTIMSFTSRMGEATRGFSSTSSEAWWRNLT
jgi:hypothetical protein